MAKKKKKNNLLHKTERDILVLLNRNVAPLTINQVADKLEISYMTAKKYIQSLIKKNVISKYG